MGQIWQLTEEGVWINKREVSVRSQTNVSMDEPPGLSNRRTFLMDFSDLMNEPQTEIWTFCKDHNKPRVWCLFCSAVPLRHLHRLKGPFLQNLCHINCHMSWPHLFVTGSGGPDALLLLYNNSRKNVGRKQNSFIFYWSFSQGNGRVEEGGGGEEEGGGGCWPIPTVIKPRYSTLWTFLQSIIGPHIKTKTNIIIIYLFIYVYIK